MSLRQTAAWNYGGRRLRCASLPRSSTRRHETAQPPKWNDFDVFDPDLEAVEYLKRAAANAGCAFERFLSALRQHQLTTRRLGSLDGR